MSISINLAKVYKESCSVLLGRREYVLDPDCFRTLAYPIDLDFTLDDEARHFEPKDEAGLPRTPYASVGTQYNPTRLAAFGLASFSRWLRKNEPEYKNRFKASADWFLKQPAGLFWYDFAWGSLQPKWLSCMAQGEGISLLVRAYATFGDARYRDQALSAVEPLLKPLGEGGLGSRIDGRWDFLEEYPETTPKHTLNGFLFALMGLSDLRHLGKSSPYQGETHHFTKILENTLERFDLGFWSAYDLHRASGRYPNPATTNYHSLHIAQLSYLGQLYESQPILAVRDRWDQYQRKCRNRCRALIWKLRYRRLEKPQR